MGPRPASGVARNGYNNDVEVHPGAMSTVIAGSEDAVFAALREGYRAATARGDVVVVATLSNACPIPETPHGEGAANAGHQPG